MSKMIDECARALIKEAPVSSHSYACPAWHSMDIEACDCNVLVVAYKQVNIVMDIMNASQRITIHMNN